jgi:hypothetical protein
MYIETKNNLQVAPTNLRIISTLGSIVKEYWSNLLIGIYE